MTTPASLAQQLAEEQRAKQRQYVLTNTRARWGLVGFGMLLLALVRLLRIGDVSWLFITVFVAAFAGVTYAMIRLTRETEFRSWYAALNLAIDTAMISAVLYGIGPTGHVLYGAYLIAPLQAALYLGRREAWGALALNIAGFALVTALRAGEGSWTWTMFLHEALVGAFACVALVPMLGGIVARLRATRGALAQVERGDLTVKVRDPELDELGYLGLSVNRTTQGIAEIVRQVQAQAQDLAAMAQEFAASAEELQVASQEIAATAQQLSNGTERQRQLISTARATRRSLRPRPRPCTTALRPPSSRSAPSRTRRSATAPRSPAPASCSKPSSRTWTAPRRRRRPSRRGRRKSAGWWTASATSPARRTCSP